jgi:hypothetical protein
MNQLNRWGWQSLSFHAFGGSMLGKLGLPELFILLAMSVLPVPDQAALKWKRYWRRNQGLEVMRKDERTWKPSKRRFETAEFISWLSIHFGSMTKSKSLFSSAFMTTIVWSSSFLLSVKIFDFAKDAFDDFHGFSLEFFSNTSFILSKQIPLPAHPLPRQDHRCRRSSSLLVQCYFALLIFARQHASGNPTVRAGPPLLAQEGGGALNLRT